MILHEPTEYLSEVCNGCHSFSLFLSLSISLHFVRVCVSITNIFCRPWATTLFRRRRLGFPLKGSEYPLACMLYIPDK